jgi:hypothetical protein
MSFRPLMCGQVAVGGVSLWAVLVLLLSTLGAAWAEQRGVALQALRTSTSTTLPGLGLGDRALVKTAAGQWEGGWGGGVI